MNETGKLRFAQRGCAPQSARGLAQSKTLRVVWASLENARAFWSAAALRRFSGVTKTAQRQFTKP
jgi:hypothetical protein